MSETLGSANGQLRLPFDRAGGAGASTPEGAAGPKPRQGRPADRRTGHRKLHIGHIAFMRAVVQGLDARSSWDRYLRTEGSVGDARQVRSTITWIRDEFAAAAKRHGRFATARLVRLDLERADAVAKTSGRTRVALMSLEDFALERGLEDFSYAEQLEAYTEYQAEQGGNARAELGRARRRERIVQRQLEALLWLEQLVGEPPAAADPVGAWLNPDLARRIEAGGILTLSQLADRINGIGKRWYAPLRALGPAKAARIEAWMRDHEPTTGLALGAHTAKPRHSVSRHELGAVVAPAAAMRPLNKLHLPPELDGSRGMHRSAPGACRIPATTDIQAIDLWLASLAGEGGNSTRRSGQEGASIRSNDGPSDSHPANLGCSTASTIIGSDSTRLSATQRCYRKEAERFLLWAVLERCKPLASVTAEDCDSYLAFVADPQPRDRWCGPRSRERWSPLWRPFEGPLGAAAQRTTRTALRQLFTYLVHQSYLSHNPWPAVRPRAVLQLRDRAQNKRALWDVAAEKIDALRPCSATVRIKWVLAFLRSARLSLRAAASARTDDLRWCEGAGASLPGEGGPSCMLSVRSSRGRKLEVPLTREVVELLQQHLLDRGLSADLRSPDNQGVYLIGKVSDIATEWPGAEAMLRATGRRGRLPPPNGEAPGLADALAAARSGISAHTLYGALRRLNER